MKSIMTFIIGIVISGMGFAQDHSQHARHGFVVLGDHQTHLYHLARFNSPHQWQGLFEIAFQDSKGAKIDIAEVRAQWPKDTILSLASNSHFELKELADRTKPFSFAATLYAGYLRNPDKKLIRDDIQVIRLGVPYFTEILTTDKKLDQAKLILVCDSSTDIFYAAHVASGGPSFEELHTMRGLARLLPYTSGSEVRCSPELQGTVVNVINREGDQPLKLPNYLKVFLSESDLVVEIERTERIVLDDKAINMAG